MKTIELKKEKTETEKGNVPPVFSAREYISTDAIRKLSELNPLKSTLDILFEYVAIASAIAVSEYFKNPFVYALAVIFIGARIYAFGMLLHEGLHYRLAKKKSTNELIMKWFLAWPLFINPFTFRKNHLEHHQHLHTHDDPEFVRRNNKAWEFPMHPLRLIGLFIMDITGLSLPFFFLSHKGYVVAKEKTAKQRPDYFRWIYYAVIFGSLIYFGWWQKFLLYWMLPAVTWGNLLLRIRRVSEHCAINVTDELLSRSRTTRANFLERTFISPCHINFHNEHHLFPSVPYYNLPRLHEVLMQNIFFRRKAHVCEGYINVFRECTTF